MAKVDELSEASIVSLVREILHGKDLSKVTARTVREEVISHLGNAAAADAAAVKVAVKRALDIVLTDALHEQQKRDTYKHPVRQKAEVGHPSEERKDDEMAGYEYEDQEKNDGLAEEEGEKDNVEPVQRSKTVRKAANRRIQPRPQKRARLLGGDDCPFKSEIDFNRLKRLCRQIGCPVPPSRQKGSSMGEKCANVLNFLRSKGLRDRDPIRLRKEEISAHRKRIEREKDLEGLDISNIIEEEGRPRKRRAAVRPRTNEDLPSDFSGPELSEKSDDEGEEYAISDADPV